jgi:hypothetical protein
MKLNNLKVQWAKKIIYLGQSIIKANIKVHLNKILLIHQNQIKVIYHYIINRVRKKIYFKMKIIFHSQNINNIYKIKIKDWVVIRI